MTTVREGALPSAATGFVGRRQALADVRHSMRTVRLLTLTGAGGIGKSRLATAVAGAGTQTAPDGVWLVPLASVRSGAGVADATAASLGLPDLGVRPALEQLTEHLARRRALLVLDNCEHLVDACAELTRALLLACPGLRVLATSRRTLDAPGEYVYDVPPLPPEEAAELLRVRATENGTAHRVHEASTAEVARLCAGLDGLPLAIELAASRLRTLSVAQMTTRLENRFALLTPDEDPALPGREDAVPPGRGRCATPEPEGAALPGRENAVPPGRERPTPPGPGESTPPGPGDPARPGREALPPPQPDRPALRAVIGWSHELCTPAERALWSGLSVFAGGFTLEAAEEVCAGGGVSRTEVVDLLDRLVSQSVVLVGEEDGAPRYRMLEALRVYRRDRPAGPGEREELVRRHRDHYLALARRTTADWFGPGQQEALARLRTEHANVVAALDRSAAMEPPADLERPADPGAAQARLALAAALGFHWCCNGFVGEGRRRLDEALAAAPDPTPARAAALWTAAWVAQVQGDLDTAARRLDEADTLAARLGDPLLRAYVQGERGTLALYRGRPQDAVPLFEGAVATQAALEGEPSALRWLFQLALAHLYLGDPRATKTARRALATAEAHGERLTRAYALWVLGYEAWLRGSPKESTALMRASLEVHRDFHDHAGVAMTLEVLAWGTAALGDHSRAARLLGALRPLARELGPTAAGHLTAPHARCEAAILDALGPDAYAEALADGGRYDTPRRAVELALGHTPLTPREREVAACVARGLTSHQISTALARSPRTVEGHLKSALTKLGFTCPTQIAAWWTANEPTTPDRPPATTEGAPPTGRLGRPPARRPLTEPHA